MSERAMSDVERIALRAVQMYAEAHKKHIDVLKQAFRRLRSQPMQLIGNGDTGVSR